MLRTVLLSAALVFGAANAVTAAPKIAPVPQSAWTAEQRDLAAQFPKGPTGNALGTFLTYPELVRGIYPFATYIMADSTLTPRQRELLTLRTAWDCSSQYLWSNDVPRAAAAGLSAAEIKRIAQGPDAAGWSPLEAALLRSVDDLHTNAMISTPVWDIMAKQLTVPQQIDATFTVTEMLQFATLYNSIGVEPDAGHAARLPTDVPRPVPPPRAYKALTTARIPLLTPAEFSPEVIQEFDPKHTGRPINRLYITWARSPNLFVPRQVQSTHINGKTTLTPREKDMAILRIAHLRNGDYAYGAHVSGARSNKEMNEDEIARLAKPGTTGFIPKEAALIQATDEIFANDKVSDATWASLKQYYSDDQILDIIVAAAGYQMVSMAGNAMGVQLDEAFSRMPDSTLP